MPPQPVTALVYTAAAHSANIWTPESAQGQMLEQLGFKLATLPGNLHASQSQGKRHDIVQLGGENLAAGINGESLLCSPAMRKTPRPFTPTRYWRTYRRLPLNAFIHWGPKPSVWTTTAPCWYCIVYRRSLPDSLPGALRRDLIHIINNIILLL